MDTVLARTLTVVANLLNFGYNREIEEPDRIPRREYRQAMVNPYFRKHIRDLSLIEDEENSYYTGILNILSEHCVGSIPSILGNHPVDTVNDSVEDSWRDWGTQNGIGSVIRQVRRSAARTGLGIAIPYKKTNEPTGVGLSFKSVCSTQLQTPPGTVPGDRIVDGIQYDENWDIVRIFVRSDDPMKPDEYAVPNEAIVWYKHTVEGMVCGLPECGPAFCLFPSVKRFMKAIVRGEEFRSSIPMAVELDPDIYRPEDVSGIPVGAFEYEPGMVPTLPPGTKLSGLNIPMQSDERTQFIRLVIGAAARCVQMPMNIALGDSSGHNMSTAAYDVQPWENKVKIDRVDFEPVIRSMFRMWHDRATLVSGLLPPQARTRFSYDINYDSTFQHPDPGKRANARAVDLASGSTTLHEVYTDKGKNPRRQLDREARTLGITRQQLNEVIVSTRTKMFEAIFMGGQNDTSDQD